MTKPSDGRQSLCLSQDWKGSSIDLWFLRLEAHIIVITPMISEQLLAIMLE